MATSNKGQLLQRMGVNLDGNIASVLVESIAYGIFLYLFVESTAIFMRRGLHTWPSRVTFITSLVTLLLHSVHLVTFVIGLFLSVKAALLGDPATIGDVSRVLASRDEIFPLILVENWVDQLEIYISDGVVIWRAWVLFSDARRWMMSLPVALFLGSIATGLGYLATIVTLPAYLALQTRQPVLPFRLVTAHLALSFVTNVVATMLIAYRLWAHRKLLGKLRQASRSAAQNVLVILVESGTAYCVVQLVRMVIYCAQASGAAGSPEFYVSLVMTSLATSATAMYPTVVIMFVNQQRTITECFGLDDTLDGHRPPAGDVEYRAATPGHMSFASPPTRTRTVATRSCSLQESLSGRSATAPDPGGAGDLEKASFVDSTRKSTAGRQVQTAPF
ncbi:hypothetical protein LshimejAT787_0506940 [Lyophyllum shimeji]|uniref:Uncharacterized protein n=1 Tax=Lyophyllum shimeji TaxID=47721 RepID=A0A9P3UL43_LYOSH|nr:hypothetical protein LshimejAT787_0506940 [Lyophyllum shimeji]